MPRGNGGIIGPVNTSFSGVWSLTEAQLRRSGGTWPSVYQQAINELSTGSDAVIFGSAADPYFEYTTLLLPGNGTNGAQNNTFLDGSTNNFTITRNGNTTQGTFSPFSQTGWGNYFDGSGDYLTATTSSLNTTTFTLEFWAYFTVLNSASPYYVFNLSGGGSGQLLIGKNDPGFPARCLFVDNSGSTVFNLQGGTINANEWTHFACVKDGANASLWINGTRVATTSSAASSPTFSGTSAFWGGLNSSVAVITGYLSSFRLVSGSAVYSTSSTSITVPTAPLTAISGTLLLTCQSNRFIDNSSNNFTITVNGNTSVVAFSPFNPSASWSAATYGGSGYFDGSGDYLTVANNDALNLGNSDFTIEGWFFSSASFGGLFAKRGSNTITGIAAYTDGTKIQYLCAIGGSWAVNMLGTANWVFNQWNHFAFVRSGSTFTSYINGVVSATATNSGTIDTNTGGFAIGATAADGVGSATSPFYLGNMRVVKGTAVYTAAFTPPTAPLTAITNTSLLLNFTNAGIYDATSKNDLETVGNAQISTAINNPFGLATGNMYFDGTGDYLTSPYSLLTTTFNGSFSIQLFVYFSVLPNTKAYGMKLAGAGSGAGTGWYLQAGNGSNIFNITCYGSGPNLTSTSTIVAGQWYHVAVARIGSNCSLYINGVREATTASGSGAIGNSALTSLFIGTYSGDATNSAHQLNGYISNYKSVNGYSEYNPTLTNITVPTAAFPTL